MKVLVNSIIWMQGFWLRWPTASWVPVEWRICHLTPKQKRALWSAAFYCMWYLRFSKIRLYCPWKGKIDMCNISGFVINCTKTGQKLVKLHKQANLKKKTKTPISGNHTSLALSLNHSRSCWEVSPSYVPIFKLVLDSFVISDNARSWSWARACINNQFGIQYTKHLYWTRRLKLESKQSQRSDFTSHQHK